jgi:hypothetical protein
MAVVNKNLPLLHRKEFQMMTPAPVSTGTGMFVVGGDSGNPDLALFMTSATVHYLYSHNEDAFNQIPSGALAGTFGAGSCGVLHPWSMAYTATGGSTTTVTVASASFNITGYVAGNTIEFISAGTASGFRTTISSVITSAGAGTITLNLTTAAPTAILNAHTFRINSGRFFIMNAGTVAAGIFKYFDVATMTWNATALATTNLPAAWGTDGKLVHPYSFSEQFATGTTTSATSTTLVNSAKTWTVNQWVNYQVRISGGTGIGQVRTIASNTATALTVSVAWTTTPDGTSTYVIEANEDYMYLLGNGAVTMYRYSVSANTWTVMAPTTARGGAPGSGMSANFVGVSGDTNWANESTIQDGRYIYSLRGGGAATLDRFDVTGGTSGAGAWANVVYAGTETFTTGSAAFQMGKFIFIKKDGTNRFFKYSVTDNMIWPLTTNMFADGAGVVGAKLWGKNYDSTKSIQWLYSLQNSGTALHRIMVY